jgi:hypothetical protein
MKKSLKKCHVTRWLTPPPPYVTFGDIFTTPPSPLKCHVFFEWPLTYFKVSPVSSVVLDLVLVVEGVIRPTVRPDELELAAELVVGRILAVDSLAEPLKIFAFNFYFDSFKKKCFFIKLDQGFPTCGTGTTGSTRTGPRLYAEYLKWTIVVFFCIFWGEKVVLVVHIGVNSRKGGTPKQLGSFSGTWSPI